MRAFSRTTPLLAVLWSLSGCYLTSEDLDAKRAELSSTGMGDGGSVGGGTGGDATPPLLTVTLSPTEPGTDDVVTAMVQAGADPISADAVDFAWYVDDVLVDSAGPELDGAVWFERDQELRVRVEELDGERTGDSTSVVVRNSAPTAPTLAIELRQEVPALVFDGLDDFVEIPPDPSLEFGDAFTAEGWIRWDDLGLAGYEHIWQVYWGTGDDIPFRLHVHNGSDCGHSPGDLTLLWSQDRTFGCDSSIGGSGLVAGAWQHVAIVFDQTEWRIYVDGQLVTSAVVAEPPGRGVGSTLSLGGNYALPENTPFGGAMAQVRITHAAVYDSESFHPEFPLTLEADTALLYDFTEGTGGVLADGSGFGNDGAIDGASWATVDDEAFTNGTLVCSIDVGSADADGDPVSYAFAWDVDGVAFDDARSTTEPGDTVPGPSLDDSGLWTCTVTPSDGMDTGPEATAVFDFNAWSNWTSQWLDVDAEAQVDAVCAVDAAQAMHCWSDGSGTGLEAVPASAFVEVSIYENMENYGEAQGACGVTADGGIECWPVAPGVGFSPVPPPSSGRYRGIDCGLSHCCALDETGGVACWGATTGNGGRGQASEFPTGTGYQQVAGGVYDACALTEDGRVECWGRGELGAHEVPSGEGHLAVAAGIYGACALDADGSPVCWGLFEGSEPEAVGLAQLYGHRSVMCGLFPDGQPLCWGRADDDFPERNEAAFPRSDVGFWNLGIGLYQICGIDRAGDLTCWGELPPGFP